MSIKTKEAALPLRRKPRREQRDETFEKLLVAARSLFVSRGYKASTLEQISAFAGLTKGAVYFHFGAKEAVLLELFRRAEKDVIQPVVVILLQEELSPAERLIRFTRVHGEMGVTRREDLLLLILISIEFAGQSGPIGEYVKRLYSILYAPLEYLISQGQASGQIRRDVPSTELASVIVSMHDGAFLEWYRRGGELDGRYLVEAVLSVLLHGL